MTVLWILLLLTVSIISGYFIYNIIETNNIRKLNNFKRSRERREWMTEFRKEFYKDDEIDFDRKSILEKQKRTSEKRKEILKWMNNKKDYLNSI